MAEPDLEKEIAEEHDDEKAPRRSMEADEAVKMILRGQTIEGARIENLVFKGEFAFPVRLKNCLLVKPRFEEAHFKAEVSFVRCVIERPVFSKTTTFDSQLSLNAATLVGAAITKLDVKGMVDATNMVARGRFDLRNSRFEQRITFWEAHFAGWVNIKNVEFAGEVDFRSLRADKGFVLNSCRFLSAVLFRGADITLKCDLKGSRFERDLDFSRAKLHDYVYLEEIEMGQEMRFAFYNALGEHILVTPTQLTGRLKSEVNGDHSTAAHEYAFLKRSYANLHRYEDEDWAFYRFKVNQRRKASRTWYRPWTKLLQALDYLLLDQGCGYCTNPWRAVRSAAFIILGFGLLFAIGIDQFYVDKKPFEDQEATSFANRTMIGLLTSVSAFTSGLGGIKEMAKSWMNVPLIIEALLGTLLWGLFIVAFSRKVIR
jgi:hypothetical protein